MRNSTIIPKKRKLDCGCFDYAFSNNMCKQHASLVSFNKRMEKVSGKLIQDEDLGDLIKDADAIVSLFVRLSAANENGFVECFTCHQIIPYKEAQAGHYIGRANMLLRYDVGRNIRVQCGVCNMVKKGNLALYAQNLEKQNPGLPDILQEEAGLVYKISRDELRSIISEYSIKVKELQKKLL